MRRSVLVLAATAALVTLAPPATAARHAAHYRHHERYRGDYYDYPDHQEPYWEDGPYDGSYSCWRQPDSKGNPETWCDHYWGYQPGTADGSAASGG
jgi:hypothetical protein